jgi:hypothetical protein
MGIYNSTQTRVVPVFNHLYTIDPSGSSWVSLLLDFASDSDNKPTSHPGVLKEAKWWPDEKKLTAPISLLEWLIRNLQSIKPSSEWGESEETVLKREQLINRNEQTIDEALTLLYRNTKEKAWYILEGPSCPDVYLETSDAVIVIEGKRTEGEPTTNTTWMENRHQMIRHLDCAYEQMGDKKRLYGLMIVEAENQENVPNKWLTYQDLIKSNEILAGSLPHRSEKVRKIIRDSFLGITTWQKICGEMNIANEILIKKVENL